MFKDNLFAFFKSAYVNLIICFSVILIASIIFEWTIDEAKNSLGSWLRMSLTYLSFFVALFAYVSYITKRMPLEEQNVFLTQPFDKPKFWFILGLGWIVSYYALLLIVLIFLQSLT